MNNNKDYEKLKKILKYKLNVDGIFFVSTSTFSLDNIIVYPEAILINSPIFSNDDELYLSVLYNGDIENITDEKIYNEGLVKLSYDDLASILISKKIVAFFSNKNKEDIDIKKLVCNINI